MDKLCYVEWMDFINEENQGLITEKKAFKQIKNTEN